MLRPLQSRSRLKYAWPVFLVPALHPLLIPLIGMPSHLLWWIHVLPVAVLTYFCGARIGTLSLGLSAALVVSGERVFGHGYGEPAPWETAIALAVALTFTNLLVFGFALYARNKDAENKLLAMFPRENPHPILESDETGRIVYANPATKLVVDELGLDSPSDFLPPFHERWVHRALADKSFVDKREIECKGRVFAWSYYPHRATNRVHIYAMDVSRQKRLEERLRHQAVHDSQTGLPNRALFTGRLEQALRRGERNSTLVAVMFIDVDRFKVVNDTLGHGAGDMLLQSIAHRMQKAFRDADVVARLGGDEFGILLEDLPTRQSAVQVARRLTEVFDAPFQIGETTAPYSASIGIAFSDDGVGDSKDLLRYADVAMYRAKEREGTTFEIFDRSLDAAATERLHRESELRRAIECGEITCHFQPVVHLGSGRTTAVEALARWEHPERGLVSPGRFIPLAEDTGLIVAMGRELLRTAIARVQRWDELGATSRALQLNVNLSPRQFQDPSLVSDIQLILEETGFDPARLQFELTESLAMDGFERIGELKELGVSLAIDDFGTGYSSLAYLQDLDVDTLKIDRSFVSGLASRDEDDAITETIITLANTLEMKVVAEGIEEKVQLRRLQQLGCEFGQGYYFARPRPHDQHEHFLRSYGVDVRRTGHTPAEFRQYEPARA